MKKLTVARYVCIDNMRRKKLRLNFQSWWSSRLLVERFRLEDKGFWINSRSFYQTRISDFSINIRLGQANPANIQRNSRPCGNAEQNVTGTNLWQWSNFAFIFQRMIKKSIKICWLTKNNWKSCGEKRRSWNHGKKLIKSVITVMVVTSHFEMKDLFLLAVML